MEISDGIQNLIENSQNIVITTHFKPDGDALGSSLALYHYLNQLQKKASIVVPSDYPNFLNWLPGNEHVINYLEQKELSQELIQAADLIICLDFNALSRTQDLEGLLEETTCPKLMMDHHLLPSNFDQFRVWDASAAATCQIVYRFISGIMGHHHLINKDIATCLYTGIMTDTGSFRFSSTTKEVHEIIADLIDIGAENWKIHEHIYNSNSEKRLKFLGYCLAEKLKVIEEYKTAYFTVTQEELDRFQVETGETEGLVNYALSIKGIQLAALIIDRGQIIKLSFRSIGKFPCNELSMKHFNGGGHRNAAGGNSHEKLEDVVSKFESILPEYKEELLNN